ncbi:MAG TPA: zinc-ribbon domain-containing protein [Candidatus Merdisoma merdipullorum]|nr:zinc-ribbon domain-containing protein [Candidatus Merdisoma merdipullorum]
MKICGSCGAEAQDDSLFCERCGARLDQAVREETEEVNFCFNCGEKLEGDMEFCPNCGMNLRTGEGGEVKIRKKGNPSDILKGLRLPGGRRPKKVAAAAVICLAAFFVVRLAGTVFASPAKRFVSYQEKTLQTRIVDGLARAAETFNLYTHLSTDITLTASSGKQEVDRYLEDSAIELKVALGEDSALVNGGLTLLGSQVMTAALTYDKGVAGFYIPELSDTYYTVDLAGLDGYFVSSIGELKNKEIPVNALRKLANKYIGLILDTADEDNVTLSEEKTFRQEELREDVKGKTYIFEPSAEDIEGLMLKLADTIENDRDLREFILDLQKDNIYLYMEDFENTLEETIQSICENLRAEAEYIGESLEGFQWTIGVAGNKVLLQSIESRDEAIRIGYETDGSQTVLYAYSYGDKWLLDIQKEGKRGEESGSVSLYLDDSEMAELEFEDMDTDKKSILQLPYGKYELKAQPYGYINISLEAEVGEGENRGTDHTIALGGLTSGWEWEYLNGLEITLNTSDKASTASAPRAKQEDITDYSELELMDLIGDFERMVYDILSDSGLSFLGYLW